MKATFVHKLVNGPFDDPSLFVRITREKRAFLIDIGNISRLDPGDLQKITDIFVTHTHIDHFIGFDFILRALLRRETPLRLYGPRNITDCIEGKLRGYTWNLIQEYPLKIDVFRIDSGTVSSTSFHAENSFLRRDNSTHEFTGILLRDPLLTVRAVQLDHQIPCLAFSIDEEFHINIDKALLVKKDLPVGPWLSEFKNAIRQHQPEDTEFVISGNTHTLGDLLDIAKITKGQKISYVTDASLHDENIRKIIDFVRDSDTLYCEAYFMDKDMDKALQRFHLTGRIVGKIAREAGVKNLVLMHFSPRYRGLPDNPEDEAMTEFRLPTSS